MNWFSLIVGILKLKTFFFLLYRLFLKIKVLRSYLCTHQFFYSHICKSGKPKCVACQIPELLLAKTEQGGEETEREKGSKRKSSGKHMNIKSQFMNDL